MKFGVTDTRTSGIVIEVNSKEEAYDKVLSMSTFEINKHLSSTGWEPSDVNECKNK